MKQKMPRFIRLLAAVLVLMLTAAAALAEPARVVTPGGAMNMRKKADKKSPLVDKVPNGAVVEADEISDGWAHVTYQGKSGYVMTEYLRLASEAVGKTLYSDCGLTCVRESADESAPIAELLGPGDGMLITGTEGGFYTIQWHGETGYVPILDLLSQNEAPVGSGTVALRGILLSSQPLLAAPDAGADAVGQISLGDEAGIVLFDKDWCLLEKGGELGYVPTQTVQMTGLKTMNGQRVSADELQGQKPLTAEKAQAQAEKALKKQFKSFKAGELTPVCDLVTAADGFEGPLYRFTFIDSRGKYGYGIYLNALTGESLYTADYTPFGYQLFGRTQFLSAANENMRITVQPGTARPGELMEITAESDSAAAYSFNLYQKGKTLSLENKAPYSTVYFRPTESGVYRLEVIAYDESGASSAAQTSLWVAEQEEIGEFSLEEPGDAQDSFTLYSQTDGWWKIKKYRKSNLQVSGCAIFTLSHALQLLGHTEESALPENLAITYAACLVDGGTLNASLVGRAAKEFNYSTKSELIKDPGEIKDRFARGAVFSFSVVKGHIALAAGLSEDGEMVHILDSAPSATLERIKNAQLYIPDGRGGFQAIADLSEIPGAKYYFETASFGGLDYYLPMAYVAKRGVRLIQPK